MGEMSEMLEHWLDLEEFYGTDYGDEFDYYFDLLARKVWCTRTGEEIPISKMSTTHIQNCMNWISRNFPKDSILHRYIPLFEEELRGRQYGT